jgi:cobalt/nickel transport system ATP-binding protein
MIEHLILNLKTKYGISVVIATHDLDLAARVADRVCLVKNGSVFAEGNPSEIFYDSALVAEAGLMAPHTVRLYLEYCVQNGIKPLERPIRLGDVIKVLRNRSKGYP